jgi:hypothetical protein
MTSRTSFAGVLPCVFALAACESIVGFEPIVVTDVPSCEPFAATELEHMDPAQLIVADVNADGKADLLWTQPQPPSGGPFRNTVALAPTFTHVTDTAMSAPLQQLNYVPGGMFVDINFDQKVDYIRNSFLGGNGVMETPVVVNETVPGTATLKFNAVAFLHNVLDARDGLASGDLNNDGKPDLIGWAGTTVQVALNSSPPGTINPALLTFRAKIDVPNAAPAGTAIQAVQVADFDRDGLADLLVVSAGPNNGPKVVSFFRNRTNATPPSFGKLTASVPALESAAFLAAGDVDRDGRVDLVVTVRTGNQNFPRSLQVLRNTGATSDALSFTVVELGDQLIPKLLYDLDDDGKPDIVGTSNFMFIRMNTTSAPGTPEFGSPPGIELSVEPDLVFAVGDQNGDGIPDLVALNYNGADNRLKLLLSDATCPLR